MAWVRDTAQLARFVQEFLQSGTDLVVITLWLDIPARPSGTQYLEANLAATEAEAVRQRQPHTDTSSPRRPTPRLPARPLIMRSYGRPPANRKPQPAQASTHAYAAELHITTS
jgi:hypothetical protein